VEKGKGMYYKIIEIRDRGGVGDVERKQRNRIEKRRGESEKKNKCLLQQGRI
jgi:hypothetical protein